MLASKLSLSPKVSVTTKAFSFVMLRPFLSDFYRVVLSLSIIRGIGLIAKRAYLFVNLLNALGSMDKRPNPSGSSSF